MSRLTINEGETKSYSVRLTKQPHVNADDDWWVMIVVDGHRRSVEYYPDTGESDRKLVTIDRQNIRQERLEPMERHQQ